MAFRTKTGWRRAISYIGLGYNSPNDFPIASGSIVDTVLWYLFGTDIVAD